MNTLFIDTSEAKKANIKLDSSGRAYEKQASSPLPAIESVLLESGKSVSDIDTIEVNEGPGSFTGLRVGVAIANALSFCIGITVNNKGLSEIALPKYDQDH